MKGIDTTRVKIIYEKLTMKIYWNENTLGEGEGEEIFPILEVRVFSCQNGKHLA